MADVTDTYGANDTSQGTLNVEYYGITIETNLATTLTKVTKSATCTATKSYLYSAASSLLDTQSFSGNDAVFSYALASLTKYYIVAGSDDASFTGAYTTVTHPVAGTNIDCIGRCVVNPPAAVSELAVGYIHAINSVTSDASVNVTVTPSTLTLSTTAQTPTIIVLIIPAVLTLTASPLDGWVSISGTYQVVGGTGGIRTRAIANRYPVTSGLTAGTTSQTGHQENLIPQEGSNVPKRLRRGF